MTVSDNWIALVPEDPMYVPSAQSRERALERFRKLAPDADDIEIKVCDKTQFFECGANFERITCPACGAEIPMDWWQNRMDDDYTEDGFALSPYPVPCCQVLRSLNDLVYEWPQCFGRFALDAMNPNIGKLEPEVIAEFERILGTRVRAIYQHI